MKISPSYVLLCGDAIDQLKGVPTESVHCVVTSPPYYGLRDYGTATWEGGDPKCTHTTRAVAQSKKSTLRGNGHGGDKKLSPQLQQITKQFSGRCARCGAVRVDQQIGLESSPEAYCTAMVTVFEEVKRVLRPDGVVWLNLGDSYADVAKGCARRRKDSAGVERPSENKLCERCGTHFTGGPRRRYCSAACGGSDNTKRSTREGGLKAKDLIGIPWMVAFALRAAGWYLRSAVIWCLSGSTHLYARTQKGVMPAMLKDLVRLDPSTVELWTGKNGPRL